MFNENLFGERLKTLRIEKNLTLEQLGLQFNVTKQTVSRWETGKILPTIKKLCLLCDFYCVPIDYLTGHINESNNHKMYVENFQYTCDDNSMLINRIKQLADENNITIAKIERSLNFGKATIAKWKISSPSAEKLYKVANFLSVSVEYLLTGKNIYPNPTTDISPNEVTCSNYTEKFDQLTPLQQERILEKIQTYLEIKNESDN